MYCALAELVDGATVRPGQQTCLEAAENARRGTRLLKNAPMLGKENCYKYFRISLKMSSFTSNNTL